MDRVCRRRGDVWKLKHINKTYRLATWPMWTAAHWSFFTTTLAEESWARSEKHNKEINTETDIQSKSTLNIIWTVNVMYTLVHGAYYTKFIWPPTVAKQANNIEIRAVQRSKKSTVLQKIIKHISAKLCGDRSKFERCCKNWRVYFWDTMHILCTYTLGVPIGL